MVLVRFAPAFWEYWWLQDVKCSWKDCHQLWSNKVLHHFKAVLLLFVTGILRSSASQSFAPVSLSCRKVSCLAAYASPYFTVSNPDLYWESDTWCAAGNAKKKILKPFFLLFFNAVILTGNPKLQSWPPWVLKCSKRERLLEKNTRTYR